MGVFVQASSSGYVVAVQWFGLSLSLKTTVSRAQLISDSSERFAHIRKSSLYSMNVGFGKAHYLVANSCETFTIIFIKGGIQKQIGECFSPPLSPPLPSPSPWKSCVSPLEISRHTPP